MKHSSRSIVLLVLVLSVPIALRVLETSWRHTDARRSDRKRNAVARI